MSGNEIQHELNRLAYGPPPGNNTNPTLIPLQFRDSQQAANDWAGTSGLSIVGALNTKAGNSETVWLDLQGVCNQLAGTSGLGAPEALSRI